MGPDWQQRWQQQQQQARQRAMGAAWEQQRRAKARQEAEQARTEPVEDPFSRVEAEAARIRNELASGRISQATAEVMLRDLMVQDDHGVWWTVGLQSGTWYRYEGSNWVSGEPLGRGPRILAAQPQPSAKAAGRAQFSKTVGCLSFAGSLVLAAFAAYAAASCTIEMTSGSGETEGLVVGAIAWVAMALISWRWHKNRMR
mgnify:CR=1 FL=1